MIFLKKRILSFLCVVMLVISMIQPALASARSYDVLSLVMATKTNGFFHFYVEIDNYYIYDEYSNAALVLAIYDENGKMLDAAMEEITYDETEKKISVSENVDIASYKLMLLDSSNQLGPLCEPTERAVGYSEIEELKELKDLKIWSEDIEYANGNIMKYSVPDAPYVKTVVFADKVTYLLNTEKKSSDYDISGLLRESDDTEFEFVDTDGDFLCDKIIGTEYDTKRLTEVDIDNDRIKLGNRWLDLGDEAIEYVFEDDKGNILNPEDFEVDDVVAVVSDGSYFWNADDYVRLIKLTENTVTGTVTSIFSEGIKDYAVVNGKQYEDIFGLSEEDTGIFYISKTGKIFDFVNTVKPEFAYILEAEKETSSFDGDFWTVKLLTTDGVKEYELTESASDYFEDEHTYHLDITGDYWYFADNKSDLDNRYRLMEYKTDSDNKIKRLTWAGDTDEAYIYEIYEYEYNEYANKISRYVLEEDTAVFDITASQADDTRAVDINYLIDDSIYSGFVIVHEGLIPVFVVTEGELKETYEEEVIPDKSYAYLLDAVKESDGFGGGVWSVRLLTEDGVVTYSLAENASAAFDDYKTNLKMASDDEVWLFENNCTDLENSYRIITYTANNQDIITSFESVTDDTETSIVTIENKKYSSSRNEIGDEDLYEDAVIFDVTGYRSEDSYECDISYFQENCRYSAMAVKPGEKVNLLVVCDVEMILGNDKGFAVVTSAEEKDGAFTVNYIQDMTEGSVIFDEDSKVFTDTENFDFCDLKTGDVFEFMKNPKTNRVTCYAVLGTINDRGMFDVYTDTLLAFDDTEFVYGYISNDYASYPSYDEIEVGGVTDERGSEIYFVVSDFSNTYCYYNTDNTTEIKQYHFSGDADWYLEGSTSAKDEATFFFAKLDYGDAIDIYTMNERIIGKDDIVEEANNSVYVNCKTGDVIKP